MACSISAKTLPTRAVPSSEGPSNLLAGLYAERKRCRTDGGMPSRGDVLVVADVTGAGRPGQFAQPGGQRDLLPECHGQAVGIRIGDMASQGTAGFLDVLRKSNPQHDGTAHNTESLIAAKITDEPKTRWINNGRLTDSVGLDRSERLERQPEITPDGIIRLE
ncbi:hypothetical protein [Streptomyces sp. G1]|uniref:hypothetical protein n=1 Tax=Streptomyces sp. G1 TaxID=361572 RepID=UPI002030051D|nr:hypothetical protein [Streptomyces sp. G1]MCM1973193.1 hypothetical protein [Streptomyces sp. G1]